jgi:hypothetical protein
MRIGIEMTGDEFWGIMIALAVVTCAFILVWGATVGYS